MSQNRFQPNELDKDDHKKISVLAKATKVVISGAVTTFAVIKKKDKLLPIAKDVLSKIVMK